MARKPEVRGYTSLHEAVYFGKVSEIRRLLEAGEIDVNARTPNKETPLHYALCHNKVECIEPLIIHGANPNKRDMCKLNPLTMGVLQKNYAAISKLIEVCKERGVELKLNKATGEGETALHYAACHNVPQAVKILVEAGANIDVLSNSNASPYMMARNKGHSAIVKYLVAKGADQTRHAPLPPVAIIKLPSNINDGYLLDEWQRNHQIDFGGTLWEKDLLEPFYSGKKPKEGQTVEIVVKLKNLERGLTQSRLRGIIHTISEDKKTIISTVRINCDHEGILTSLSGEWEATLQVDVNKEFPWVLTKLVQNTNPLHVYALLQQIAKSQEDARGGKKFILAKKPDTRCWHLKGTENQDASHDHGGSGARIIVEINLMHDGTMQVTFEEGETEEVPRDKAVMVMQTMMPVVAKDYDVQRNVKLMMEGAEIPWQDFLTMHRR